MKKTVLYLILAAATISPVNAQETRPFQHLDVSLNTGTTGIGLDLGTNITKWMDVRAGFTFMPHFKYNMNFEVGLYADDGTLQEGTFQKLSEKLEQITGYKVHESIGMIGEPVFNQFKLMMDFYPLKNNKHWYVSAGFYVGKQRIAKAYNSTEDMPSLIGVGIYNQMHDKILNDEPVANIGGHDVYLNEYKEVFKSYGRMAIHVGDYTHDIYHTYTEDVVCDENFKYTKLDANGNPLMEDGFPVYYEEGEVMHTAGSTERIHKAGDPYMMTPDEDGMVRARMLVNAFRPYVGIGYDGRIVRGDDRYHIGFDAGIMMWGGTPCVITHDGTDLTHDVTNVPGKVGDYVSIVKAFKVYPVISLRLTRRF